MELGILDWCLLEVGRTRAYPLASSVELAKIAEQLGYTRYWLSEHHDADVAHSCPEVLAAIMATETSRIKIGTAGILMRHHNWRLVGQVFLLLQSLFGDRIECGLSCSVSNAAVNRGLDAVVDDDVLDANVRQLRDLLQDRYTGSKVSSKHANTWIVGGVATMRRAAKYGLSYGMDMLFQVIDLARAKDLIAEYRETFQSRDNLVKPHCVIAVAGACAESDTDAQKRVDAFTRIRPRSRVKPRLIGDRLRCSSALVELSESSGTDGAVFLDLSHEYYAKVKAYEELMEGICNVARGTHLHRCA